MKSLFSLWAVSIFFWIQSSPVLATPSETVLDGTSSNMSSSNMSSNPLALKKPQDLSGLRTDDGRWITIGEDAFETLTQRLDLGFRHQALKAHARKSGLVVTQIHNRDMARVSALLHETHQRCGGFIAHDSEEDAKAALKRHFLPEIKALPKVFEINQGPLVRSLVAKLNRTRMMDTIEALSTRFPNRYYEHASGREASVYLRNLWADYARNRSDVSVALRSHAGWPQPSVIATITGRTLPDEVVILGGHLDSIAPGSGSPTFSAPGADDNASGIAVISEVLRAMTANGFRPDRTIQLMGYAAEEVGLQGSREIARQYAQDGVNVVAVMQLDMTGFAGSNEDIVMIGDFTSNPLNQFVGRLVDTYQPTLRRTTSNCGYACSDHAAWHEQGFPVAFPHEARFGQGNPVIHTVLDTIATISNNGSHAFKFARLAAAFLVETAFEPVTAPTSPTNLTANNVGKDTVDLSWTDGADNEDSFELEQRRSDEEFELFGTTGSDITTLRVDSLSSGTAYSFRVRATNDGGASSYSNVVDIQTLGEPPPSGLQVDVLSARQVRLSWTDPSNSEDGFRVELRTESDSFSPSTEVSADITEVTVDDLEPETLYTFRVQSLGGEGDSTFSDEIQATTFIANPEPCVADEDTLCLRNGRFRLEVLWSVDGESRNALVVPGGTQDSGLLWFFSPNNWELLVKLLDACALNHHFWVFSAATTDLAYTMTVTDTWSGYQKVYGNDGGQAAETVTDIEAFATCSALEP